MSLHKDVNVFHLPLQWKVLLVTLGILNCNLFFNIGRVMHVHSIEAYACPGKTL